LAAKGQFEAWAKVQVARLYFRLNTFYSYRANSAVTTNGSNEGNKTEEMVIALITIE
jgi:hypothetical protein